MENLVTLGEIARRMGVRRSRVDYAVEKAGIQERGRAGILRLFSASQIPVIEAALSTVRTRRPATSVKGTDSTSADSGN